jgi:hypothetical protein
MPGSDPHCVMRFLTGRTSMLDWQPIATVPDDRSLELSVIENGRVHALVFPCRRTAIGWADAATRQPVFVEPTHWRLWPDPDAS